MMRKSTCLLLCLSLACSCLFGAALAGNTPLHMIRDDERMLLGGRDIFSYSASELYVLWNKWGPADDERIRLIGLRGDDYKGFEALDFPFVEFEALALAVTSEPPDPSLHSMLSGQIAQQANYPVVRISISEPGTAGPFGIHVGMAAEELTALPLHYAQHPSLDAVSDDFDDWLLAHYQDIDERTGGIDTYELQILLANGAVSYFYVVLLDWDKDTL